MFVDEWWEVLRDLFEVENFAVSEDKSLSLLTLITSILWLFEKLFSKIILEKVQVKIKSKLGQ